MLSVNHSSSHLDCKRVLCQSILMVIVSVTLKGKTTFRHVCDTTKNARLISIENILDTDTIPW